MSTEKPTLGEPSVETLDLELTDYAQQHEVVTSDNTAQSNIFLDGYRLYAVLIAVLTSLFLINMEVSIVGTALNNMSNDLSGFSKSSWVVNGFLLSFVGSLNISAKLSDIYGRKPMTLLSLLLFTAFSGACGGATSMVQLIVFRVLQGLGAGSLYSIMVLIVYELVPRERLGRYAALCSLSMTAAAAVAPILGGAIAANTSWRWVFLIMCPLSILAAVLFMFFMPGDYPRNRSKSLLRYGTQKTSVADLGRIDLAGAVLLLAAVTFLILGLYEGSTSASWSSPTVIGCLVASGVAWILLNLWERRIEKVNTKQEPIFPWRFYFNRPWLGLLLLSLIVGLPFNFMIVTWPQRYQIVTQDDPFTAGLRLLPYVVTSTLVSAGFSIICERTKVAFFWMLLAAGMIQLIGIGLLAGYAAADPNSVVQYVGLALNGIGVGGQMGIIALMTPGVVEKRDLATGTGSVLLMRELGGAIGLAIATAIQGVYLRSHLTGLLSAIELQQFLDNVASIVSLESAKQVLVRDTYADAYALEIKVMCGIAALQVLLPFMVLRKGQQYRAS